MAIWKEQSSPRRDGGLGAQDSTLRNDLDSPAPGAPGYDIPRRAGARDGKESLIAANLTIEGKIEGAGHIRLAGRFKGDVHVDGDLTIEPGAKLTGGVRAHTVVIGGELEGNIEGATRVELQQTGSLVGNVIAGSLTVAAGSRMRGQADFGGEETGSVEATEPYTAS